jgi:Ser-tRNA(Ala) deacylase AlaX
MTRPLFYDNSDLMQFDSVIQNITNGGSEVVLSETAFYPTGGGQPCDVGVLEINGTTYNVTDVRSVGNDIYHRVDQELLPDLVGAAVHGSIDEARRRYHSRMHSALHLLNTYMLHNFNARVTGGQVGTHGEPSRHDFELDRGLTPEERAQIEEWVNQIVVENKPVTAKYVSDEESRKLPGFCRTRDVEIRKGNGLIRGIEIPGVDLQACGGTHVCNTGEIGRFRIQKVDNKGKMLRRIVIRLELPTE